jgi:hypothetical protein
MNDIALTILILIFGGFCIFAGYMDGYVTGRQVEEEQWRSATKHVETFGFKFCRLGQEEGNG